MVHCVPLVNYHHSTSFPLCHRGLTLGFYVGKYHGTGYVTSMVAIYGVITLCLAREFSVLTFGREIPQS